MTYVTLAQMIDNVEAGAEILKLRAKSPKALELINQVIANLKSMTVAQHHASIWADGECAVIDAKAGVFYLTHEINRLLVDAKRAA